MADELFNVIFRGDTVAGHNLADVKARFAQLFKMDPAKVEGFFAGKPVVLKANCDRATGDKFKAALANAGAIVEVKSVTPAVPVSAPVATAPVATTPVATPAPVVAAPAPAPTPTAPPQAAPQPPTAEPANPWSLAATGSDLLRANEINQLEPVQVDISKISLVKHNPFSSDAEEPLEAARHVSAPPLDLSNLKLGEVGETLVEFKEFVPRNIDLSELSLAAPGTDVLREDERQQFVPANVDTSGMDIAPAGGDLGQIKPPPPPPAPSTDHLSVNK